MPVARALHVPAAQRMESPGRMLHTMLFARAGQSKIFNVYKDLARHRCWRQTAVARHRWRQRRQRPVGQLPAWASHGATGENSARGALVAHRSSFATSSQSGKRQAGTDTTDTTQTTDTTDTSAGRGLGRRAKSSLSAFLNPKQK